MGKEGAFWSVEIQSLILELYSVLLQISRNGGDEGACTILVGEACTMRVLAVIQAVAWSQLSHAAVGEMGKPSSGPESQRQDFKIYTYTYVLLECFALVEYTGETQVKLHLPPLRSGNISHGSV